MDTPELMNKRRLRSIANNPNHPMHTHAISVLSRMNQETTSRFDRVKKSIEKEKKRDKTKHTNMIKRAKISDIMRNEKKGLWYYIKQKQQRGEPMNPKGHKDAPTPDEIKKAQGEATSVRQDPDIKDRKGTQPAKYYSNDMSVATKKARDAHFKDKKKGPAPGDGKKSNKISPFTAYVRNMMGENFKDGKNPERKGLAKRSGVDTKASISDLRKTAKNSSGEKQRMAHWLANMKSGKKKAKEDIDEASFADKSKASGISVNTLKKVYQRGVAAHKTGHRPGTTPSQWGHARVNAFIAKKKKGTLNHDKDLA
tara:strand:- start:6929 stop:7861 length:933 start_codon:yes stop_codon:yes gene_type:complete